MTLTERTEAWKKLGVQEEFRGHTVNLRVRDGEGPLILLLHGFPTSSYDWSRLMDIEKHRAFIAPDFLGFGLSDKPRDHRYVLHWQADLIEELVRRHGDGRPVFICAHDMGTSVATELFAREIEGDLGFEIAGALLFNGSIILEKSHPTFAQKMLRSKVGPVAARFTSEKFFRHQFGSLFSPDHPLTDEEEADQWSLIVHNDGNRLGHLLILYMDERVTYADRWHGAISEWNKPLTFAWGMLDPVAGTEVLDALKELRPQAPVAEFEDLGHYPQVEDPEALALVLGEALILPAPSL